MIRIILIITAIIILFKTLHADEFDSTYVHHFNTNFTVKANLATLQLSLKINPEANQDSLQTYGIRYASNLTHSVGIGGTYKNVQVNFMFSLSNNEKNKKVYGTTSYRNIDLNIMMRKLALRGVYQNYEGFYLANPHEIIAGWNKKKHYPQRGDIRYTNLGLETFYIVNNKKYSLHATYKQSERQKKNTGSTLFKTNINFSKIEADFNLIPSSKAHYFGNIKDITSAKYKAFSISSGYTYSFIFKKYYYVIPIFFVGPTLLVNNYILKNAETKSTKLTLSSNARLSGGYNGDLFFAGIVGDWNGKLFKPKKVNTRSESLYLRLSAGVRF